jgi:hypothetical protein
MCTWQTSRDEQVEGGCKPVRVFATCGRGCHSLSYISVCGSRYFSMSALHAAAFAGSLNAARQVILVHSIVFEQSRDQSARTYTF